eukprot:gene5485-5720_t
MVGAFWAADALFVFANAGARAFHFHWGKLRLYIDRNLTITGLGGPFYPGSTRSNQSQPKTAADSRQTAVVLDFAHQPEVVVLGPDVVLVLQNLQLENAAVTWGPNLCFIEHSARARIRLVNVVWPNPLCPPSLKWLHEQILAHTPIPAKYAPPLELEYSVLPGPFKVVVTAWNREECQEHWWSPSTCQAENTFVRQSAVEVPSSRDNRLNFDYNENTMALYEYFNMSVPCTGRVDVGCMESKGYLTCHNRLMRNIIWKNQLRDSKRPSRGRELWPGVRRHELDINMMLQHPNVVRCFDYHVSGQGPQAPGPTVTAAPSSADAALAANGMLDHPSNVHGSLSPGARPASSDPYAGSVQALSHICVTAGSLSAPGEPGSPSASWSYDQNPARPMRQVSLLLEYCDGGSLNAAIRSGLLRRHISTFSAVNNMVCVLRIALDVARGMQHLHHSNVCHGDLNSNNVLLCNTSDVPAPLGAVAKVADFGLSRLMPEQGTHLSTLTCGTITHAAPEVLLTGQLRLRSDVYSFGILLWELVHLGIPLPCAGSSGLSCPSSTSQSKSLISDPLAWPDEGQESSGVQTNLTASAGGEEGMPQLGPVAGLNAAQGRRSSKAVISSAYQELRATPWIIASKVIEGMRPVFVAPAVPGPYMELAKRCWEADPVKRPSFDEIVKLLEAVVQSDELAGVAPEGDLSSACHIGSF